ncbi:MAG: leucine-rich repeat domain-containing protein [Clostridia bacterium]|nr:leucine-rich repeat domain-containing protein [Clostridia bacterium]
MKKQILKPVFALCIVSTVLFAVACVTASAASSGTCGENLTWVLDDSATLTISGTGPMLDYEKYDGGITAPWKGKTINNVKIEEGVTSIGDAAFYWNRSLKSISIPSSITKIGYSMFYTNSSPESIYIYDIAAWCNINFTDDFLYGVDNLYLNNKKVTDLVIPDGIKEIKKDAFSYCSSLTSITIPHSVISIGESAFSYCKNLTNITISDGVTTIGGSAFSGCSKLSSVTIPDSVTSIGEGIFYGCTSLKEVTLPFIGSSRDANGTSDALFGYVFGNGFYEGQSAIQYYSPTASKQYTMPSNLRSVTITDASIIPYGAFYNCSMIDNITLNSGVKTIYADAFYNCSNLVDLTIPGSKVKFANSNVFTGCDMLTIYGIDGSSVEEYAQKYSIDFEPADISSQGATALSATATVLEGNIVITVKANGSTAEKYIPVAIYDKNGKMLDLMIVPSNEDFDVAKVVFKDIKSAAYTKLFLWSTYGNLTPLATAKQVTIVR